MDTILEWSNLSVRKRNGEFSLLRVSGHLRERKLTALIGPSNSGKSLLLEVLAGRVRTCPDAKIFLNENDHWIALATSEDRRNYLGFVSHQDSMLRSATARESLQFVSSLEPKKKLLNSPHGKDEMRNNSTPRTLPVTPAEIRQENSPPSVDEYIRLMDLTSVQNVPFKNLSLNAKRFTMVASELVCERSVLLLDSPLTGLSQVKSYQLVKLLKRLVRGDAIDDSFDGSNRSSFSELDRRISLHELGEFFHNPPVDSKVRGVLCTLKQPTSEVLSLFDDVLLIGNRGRVIYQGPLEEMAPWFGKFGHVCPPHYNVTDFALFVLHSVPEDSLNVLVQGDKIDSEETPIKPSNLVAASKYESASFFTQLNLLLKRDYLDIVRNWKSHLVYRLSVSVVLSIVTGLVYFNIGQIVTADSLLTEINAYRGCVVMLGVNAMLGNAHATILAIPQQKKIFQKEKALNMYSSMAYLTAKIPMEYCLSVFQATVQFTLSYFLCGLNGNFGVYLVVLLAISVCADSLSLSVSCITESTLSAIQMVPIALFPQIIFTEVIISLDNMPTWITWLQYICFLPYATKLLMVNEFGCDQIHAMAGDTASCDHLPLDGSMLVAVSVLFRLVGLTALHFKRITYK